MDIEKLKTLALKLQGELLTSSRKYLSDEKISHTKLIDLHENAQKILPDHKTLFERHIETLKDPILYITTKEAADLCKDIFEYAILEDDKKEKSETLAKDPLTDLFEKNKLAELDFSKYKELSIAFLDLDNFKKINDKYKHNKGDLALIQVASALKEIVGKNHWVLRNHGSRGDEFIVVFLDLEKEKAFRLIEECRKKIEHNKVENFNITVSIGIASYPNDGKTLNEIIEKADEAMYLSKENGRNCTTLYDESMVNEIETINFRLEEIANIKNGAKVIVKSWKCHQAPNITNLEAIELRDLDEDILYTSRNKGGMATIITIEKEIRGVVRGVKRPPGQTLFELVVQKKQLEGISSDPKDFLSPLVR